MLDTNDQDFYYSFAKGSRSSFAAVVSAITVTTTPTLLLGFGNFRHGLSVVNTTAEPVYIKLGPTVSPALYSFKLRQNGLLDIDDYSGVVSACTNANSSVVMVTERL